MSDLEKLKVELPRLRTRVQSIQPEEAAAWTSVERIRFDRELHWCIEAMKEFKTRLQAISLHTEAPQPLPDHTKS